MNRTPHRQFLRRFSSCSALLAALILAATSGMDAQTWVWKNPLPHGNTNNSIQRPESEHIVIVGPVFQGILQQFGRCAIGDIIRHRDKLTAEFIANA